MFLRIVHTFWGNFNQEELKKFFYIAIGCFFLVGAQWPTKLLKEGMLVGEIGANWQPTLKFISIFICLPIVFFYGFLVSRLKRETVLYLIISTLISLGLGFYFLLSGIIPYPEEMIFFGLPLNVKGFIVGSFYIYAELFMAITVAPFWSFVNDLTTPEEAKKGFGIAIFGAQLGGLITTLFGKYLSYLPNSNGLISAISTFMLIGFFISIWMLTHKIERKSLVGYSQKHLKTSETHKKIPFFQGLDFIFTSPYVAGIMILNASQEILTAIINFGFLKTLGDHFSSKAAVIQFEFDYGIMIQIIACIFSLTGTAFFQRRLGVRVCTMLYPILLTICLVATKFVPTIWVFTIALAIVKGLHYSLNKPVREILYIPTTKEVKYKAKAWIEMFGVRGFKLTGSFINGLSVLNPLAGNGIAFLIAIGWIGAAKYVGSRYHESVKNNENVV